MACRRGRVPQARVITLDDQGEARVAQVEWEAGQQMCCADSRKVDARRADGDAVVGPLGHIHGQQVRVTAKRLAAEEAAPCGIALPGRGIYAPDAVAARLGGIDRCLGCERLQIGTAAPVPGT